MAGRNKSQPLVSSLLSLCLLALLIPVISGAAINNYNPVTGSPGYSNGCAFPLAPVTVNDDSQRGNRIELNRRGDAISKNRACLGVCSNLKPHINSFSLNISPLYYIFSPRLQQVCQLLDIPPPSCLIS